MTVKGVIFDMDGVILDTEKLYIHFWQKAGRACGYPWEKRHSLAIRSLARPFAIERLKGFFGEAFDYDEVRNLRIKMMNEFTEKTGVEPKPYAGFILKWLRENGFKTALATATAPERTKKFLSSVGLYDYFDEKISASMVEKGKPEPDIYLKAAESLGLRPEECIAVEDSSNGALSAFRAGCITVMVPDMDEPDDETRSRVFAVAKDLRDIKTIAEELNNADNL